MMTFPKQQLSKVHETREKDERATRRRIERKKDEGFLRRPFSRRRVCVVLVCERDVYVYIYIN